MIDRLNRHKPNHLIKMVHLMRTNQSINKQFLSNKSNWYNLNYKLLEVIGLDWQYINDLLDVNNISIISMKKLIRDYTLSAFSSYWKRNLLPSTKLEFYKSLQLKPSYSIYLDHDKSHERKLMSWFRSGSPPLQIELLRGKNVDRKDRRCPICKEDIEDEFHFIIGCSNEKMNSTKLNIYNNIQEYFEKNNLINLKEECETEFDFFELMLLSSKWSITLMNHPQLLRIILRGLFRLWIVHQNLIDG